MTRNLKALGLALIAVFAMSAIAAGSASAQFESEAAETTVTRSANNTQVFQYQAEGVKVECSKVTATGTQVGTATTEFTTTPAYSECKSSLGSKAEVNMNGCDYLFTLAKASTSGSVHVVCPEGKKVTVTVFGFFGEDLCTLSLGSQTPAGTITFANTGATTTREVVLTSASTGISGSRTGSALCGPTTSTTGTYSGSVTGTGEKPGTNTHVGVFVD